MRLHLLELEDFEWFPNIIREGITDYLRFATEIFNVYKPTAKFIADMINKTGIYSIIDLCSGGGGGAGTISDEINSLAGKEVKILLTDKYPNITALNYVSENSNDKISFLEEPVDAVNVPDNLKGIRTLYSSFHHFKPEDAKKILADSVKNNMPIAVFEAGERSLPGIAGVIFTTIIICTFATPFMKPFKWSRLFFTYILPVIPLTLLWDGVVSMLRIYKPDEMIKMTKEINSENFKWTAGKIIHKMLKITYMIGVPESIKN
ncbi:MAG: class I SAM-dependent methyltransferase [Ignavibacteriae bacterium]|nr:MAG: class I SAM-dependent methyltransferase [Ignavibacteriota bacterium]